MENYEFLLDLAIILLSTKLLGLFTRKIRMPQVVGALLAGLILGPALLGVLRETDFLKSLAEIGAIVLMFTAGLEINPKELKNSGFAAFAIALLGVILPLFGGYITAVVFHVGDFWQNMFIGVILTATSVSITVETLKELGRLNSKVGNAILGAALIDDVIGIIGLTLITSFPDKSMGSGLILLKLFGFLLFSIFAGYIIHISFEKWVNDRNRGLKRHVIISFVICLAFSFITQYFFGIVNVTGAFVAGIIVSNTQRTRYLLSQFDTVSFLLLSPVFFAMVGMQVAFPNGLSMSLIWFGIVLTVVAIITKILGAGIGAKLCRFSTRESIQVGTGMISRGEVALIILFKGAALGLISSSYYCAVVIMVVITAVITPILLKLVFSRKNKEDSFVPLTTALIENYQEKEDMDLAQQAILEWHHSETEKNP